MARNVFARLFRRHDAAKPATVASPTPGATQTTVTSAPPPPEATLSSVTPIIGATGNAPVMSNDITERQCVSCGRDLTETQTVCPSCGLALKVAS